MSALLAVSRLEAFYGASQILHGVDLAVGKGEQVALIGRNGMGKTTLLRALMGLVPDCRGEIRFAGNNIRGCAPEEIARAGVALVPEGRGVFASLTVEENLTMAVRPGRDGRCSWTLARIYELFPRLRERRGNGGFGGIPSQAFKCADGDIFIVATTNKQFGALCEVLGEPELARHPSFCEMQLRILNREALLVELDRLFARHPLAHLLEALEAADVPASPVNDMKGVFANPQIQHRGMLTSTEHAVAGEIPVLRNPIRFSATPVGEATAPPTLGQDTDAVLRELLGRDDAQIAQLRGAGVL
mgnify:CR=1 FL=1